MLSKLHSEGADLNRADYLGRAAIHVIASEKNNLEVAKCVVEKNVNLDIVDSKHRSALFLAIECGNWEVAELLCTLGAKVIASKSRLAKMLC